MRNVEGDLRGLVEVFEECYDRNKNEIPKYDGVEINPTSDNNGSITSNINGEEYERHIKDGRSLIDALLSSAYNLGREQVLKSDTMKTKDDTIELQKTVIDLMKNTKQ